MIFKFAVIDNKRKKRGHTYNFMYVTDNLLKFEKYLKEKGIM